MSVAFAGARMMFVRPAPWGPARRQRPRDTRQQTKHNRCATKHSQLGLHARAVHLAATEHLCRTLSPSSSSVKGMATWRLSAPTRRSSRSISSCSCTTPRIFAASPLPRQSVIRAAVWQPTATRRLQACAAAAWMCGCWQTRRAPAAVPPGSGYKHVVIGDVPGARDIRTTGRSAPDPFDLAAPTAR